jgi:hypothetical protein
MHVGADLFDEERVWTEGICPTWLDMGKIVILLGHPPNIFFKLFGLFNDVMGHLLVVLLFIIINKLVWLPCGMPFSR